MKIIVLDAEIKKLIRNKDEKLLEGLEYCDGWQDHAGMGISVLGVYNYEDGRYRTFMSDNLGELQSLIDRADFVVGYNIIKFDGPLLANNGINIPPEKYFDILVEIWRASGLSCEYDKENHSGFHLAQTIEENISGACKTGNGADAPVLWQQGRIGQLIDYCMSDVFLTKKLMDSIMIKGGLYSPKITDMWLSIPMPINKRQKTNTCLNCSRQFQGNRCHKCGTCLS